MCVLWQFVTVDWAVATYCKPRLRRCWPISLIMSRSMALRGLRGSRGLSGADGGSNSAKATLPFDDGPWPFMVVTTTFPLVAGTKPELTCPFVLGVSAAGRWCAGPELLPLCCIAALLVDPPALLLLWIFVVNILVSTATTEAVISCVKVKEELSWLPAAARVVTDLLGCSLSPPLSVAIAFCLGVRREPCLESRKPAFCCCVLVLLLLVRCRRARLGRLGPSSFSPPSSGGGWLFLAATLTSARDALTGALPLTPTRHHLNFGTTTRRPSRALCWRFLSYMRLFVSRRTDVIHSHTHSLTTMSSLVFRCTDQH